MSLKNRLHRLESIVWRENTTPGDQIDPDQCIVSLGLDPMAVRELARSKGSSLIEAISEMLGIEPREFLLQLREAAYPRR